MEKHVQEALDLLWQIRAEVHGNVESSVEEMLDRAINDLEETLQTDHQKFSKDDLLTILGMAAQLLPAVAQLIERLK